MLQDQDFWKEDLGLAAGEHHLLTQKGGFGEQYVVIGSHLGVADKPAGSSTLGAILQGSFVSTHAA
jgi:hypothetical protein